MSHYPSHSQSSFRDPAGFIFYKNNQTYRQINKAGQADFDYFLSSGLYSKLVKSDLLIAHEPVPTSGWPADERRYKLIKPQSLPFVSYPYEWCFSQLRDAALLTLAVMKLALAHNMILKDASAYNVQFIGRKPLFIDTLSFRKYSPGQPWDGYKQFCQHFVSPLAVAKHRTPEIIKTLRVFLDGLPLSVSGKLLPGRTKLNRGLLSHIYFHAAYQKRFEQPVSDQAYKERYLRPMALQGLVASLDRTIKQLKLPAQKTQWGRYYEDTNYSADAFASKQRIVKEMMSKITPQPKMVWDLGANDGTFSRIAAAAGAYVVSFDIDHTAVETNYHKKPAGKFSKYIHPLLIDLTNPSPSLGWAHSERQSLVERGPADAVFALALLHHLAIGNNLPLPAIANFLSSIAGHLIIEFVPKSDSNAQRLLAGRANLFQDYTAENFETAFSRHFSLVERQPIVASARVIYLYRAKH